MSRIRYGTNAKTLPGQVENISRKYKTPTTKRVTNDPLKYHLLATCCTLPGQHLVSRVTHGDKEKLKMEMMEIGQGRASQHNNNNCSTPVIARNKREPFFNCHPPVLVCYHHHHHHYYITLRCPSTAPREDPSKIDVYNIIVIQFKSIKFN